MDSGTLNDVIVYQDMPGSTNRSAVTMRGLVR